MTEYPIHVAQVMGKMENGGVEAVVMNYYRHIDKTKVQFDFIVDLDSSCPQEDEILSMGGKVIRIAPYQSIIANMRDLKKVFTENHYKIVHVHLNTMSVFALNVSKRCGVPIRICHNHSTAAKGETKKNILKYMLRPFAKLYPTHLFACSEYAGLWLYGKKVMRNGKVTVLKNAIDLKRFCYNPQERQNVRKELGVEKSFVVGHVGRFVYQKNHDFLIDIFNKIYKKNKNSVLLLVGEGALVDEVKNKVHRLGLDKVVKFLGIRQDAYKLYQAFDVFLLPSRYEGLPVVGVEAQASGLPCVMTDTVTYETKILDSTNFISYNNRADEWADKVIESVNSETRIDTYEQMCKAGFNIETEAAVLMNYYRKLLNNVG